MDVFVSTFQSKYGRIGIIIDELKFIYVMHYYFYTMPKVQRNDVFSIYTNINRQDIERIWSWISSIRWEGFFQAGVESSAGWGCPGGPNAPAEPDEAGEVDLDVSVRYWTILGNREVLIRSNVRSKRSPLRWEPLEKDVRPIVEYCCCCCFNFSYLFFFFKL